MAVYSDGSYNTPKGVFFSFPVTCSKGEFTIVSYEHVVVSSRVAPPLKSARLAMFMTSLLRVLIPACIVL